jgi:hypothetical protein
VWHPIQLFWSQSSRPWITSGVIASVWLRAGTWRIESTVSPRNTSEKPAVAVTKNSLAWDFDNMIGTPISTDMRIR